MRLALWQCAIIPLLAATVSPPLVAQERQPLTLAAALDLAEKQNLDLAAARAQRAVVQAGVQIARQRPNPLASVAVLRDTPHESLFFDQPLELGSKRGRRIELARQEGQVTEADILVLERRVRRNVREGYFALAFARGVTQQRAEALQLAERLREIAKARFEAGDIPQLEVTQAELETARANANMQVAQQEEKVALSDLDALLNEPATRDWDLGGEFTAVPSAMSLDELLARAGTSNPEISLIGQETRAEQRREDLLKAERVPNLIAEFGSDFNSPHEFRVGPRGQLTIELPIFSRNQGQIAQSIAGQRALDQQLAATHRAVAGKVESAYLDLSARKAQVELYRDTLVPSSRQLAQLAEESYRAGRANILTVLGAQRDVQQVEREYLDSLLAMHTAFAQLEETVGASLN